METTFAMDDLLRLIGRLYLELAVARGEVRPLQSAPPDRAPTPNGTPVTGAPV